MDLDLRRIRIYQASFGLALLLLCATTRLLWPLAVWGLFAATLAGLTASFLLGPTRLPRPLCDTLVLLATAAAITVPVLHATEGLHVPLSHGVATLPLAPMILVAVMGSRLLAAVNEQAFRQLWRSAALTASRAQRQSFASAVLLGAALWLCWVWVVALLPPGGAEPALAIVHSAVSGGTLIHYAILLLFFSIVAWLGEALRLQIADRGMARRIMARIGTPQEEASLRQQDHRAITHVIRASLRSARHEDDTVTDPRFEAAQAFTRASTGFVRGLLPVLPLLGFLGTVIGLARALGDLPSALGTSGGGADLSGTLSGLAVKFETTLLGLLTSMIAAVLLNLLDKSEAELAGQTVLTALAQLPDHPGAST